MPLRDPLLPSTDISSVGDIPSSHERSPEDSLRLWQFLSISWISPLLSIGKKRQLNEEDVWSLGYEFQHQRLHEAFRQLTGPVIRRVMRANGVDVFIISFSSMLNTLAGEISRFPVRCMATNDIHRICRASTFATVFESNGKSKSD